MLITYRYQTPFCTHFCTGPLPCLFFTLLLFYILILSFKLSCSGSPQPSPFSLSLSLEALINMAHAYVNAGSAPPTTQALPRSLPLATSLYSTPLLPLTLPLRPFPFPASFGCNLIFILKKPIYICAFVAPLRVLQRFFVSRREQLNGHVTEVECKMERGGAWVREGERERGEEASVRM